ncbi:hypothetical protein TBR22_A50870 [Luteitalea sp. TBR-22]|uniref:DUF2779 domain-containing protein n=1 Tax=Luteitalea sp. TBR-22 TaxID=2802971 RepID=UPI001AF2F2F3|nr:DUF2779 domain-containing protein [Luteitalea sp. TBR-22]BCS35853.1 hypothetical protein TBR22_A50870 [Luteitalea sp. TBR-22]
MIGFSEVRAGQQCLLRAYKVGRDVPIAPLSALDGRVGTPGPTSMRPESDPLADVRALARPLFAGAESAQGDAARTRALMDAGCPRIVDAVVEADGLRVRVDVLERTARGRWIAVLIRNGVRVSWSLADRAAFTLHVLRAAGHHVAAVHAMLLDETYERPDAGPVDPHRLFVRRSVSFAAGRRRLLRIAASVAATRAALASPDRPAIAPGAHCRDSRDGCPFLDDCTAHLPADWTGWFPRKDKPPIREWLAQGFVRMAAVPVEGRQLPRGAEHARLASRAGGQYVAPTLAAALAPAGPPAYYLDFECVSPAVPLYAGTRPYAVVPFLWSVHHDDAAGNLTHVDDLAPPSTDPPLRRMAEGLIAALGPSSGEPIVVYSSYEWERLRDLAQALPDLAEPLQAIQARLVDLLEVVREHVYDLRFRGSFSIKAVAPALAPEVTYDGLGIRDGLAAAHAYEAVLRGLDRVHPGGVAPGPDRRAQVLADLRAYCARDTLAMVALHRALLRLRHA